LVLTDEPTSQLDAAHRDRVLELLGHVRTTLHTTIVVVTHDPAVAEAAER
jgi:ABC-type lipoprotein export system ATPase subunit